jgi:formate/nitrite transporter FocA (FNT family)
MAQGRSVTGGRDSGCHEAHATATIAIAAALATTVGTGGDTSWGVLRWDVGMAFSLGVMLVVLGGAAARGGRA